MAERRVLSRQTMAKQVADQLRDEIQRADLPPGTRLMQSEIAERFGVSTTPVREALTKLEGEGLIVIDQHRGAVVFHPTIADFRECFQIRELLESYAISKALPNLSEDSVGHLEALIEEMESTEDRTKWVELNNRFHLTIYEAAGLPRLVKLIAGLRDASAAYLHMFATARLQDREGLEREHRNILQACRSGDVEAGVHAVRDHLWRPVAHITQSGDGSDDFPIEALLTGRQDGDTDAS